MDIPLYTIGHGRRPFEEFLRLLQEHGIEYLVDVRSHPQSRFNPQYNLKALDAALAEAGIRYVHLGDSLGGKPGDPSLYDAGGRFDYNLVVDRPFFRAGIERLKTAYRQQLRLAFMCSESKPQECHRARLIGEVLHGEGIPVVHIDEQGALKAHEEVMPLLKKNPKAIDLE
jgi:uncharacterized protein (DUF488 family)